MKVVQNACNLNAIPDHLLLQQRGIGVADAMLERLTRHELHDHHRATLVLKQISDDRQTRMAELAKQFGFLQKETPVFFQFAWRQIFRRAHLLQRPDCRVGNPKRTIDRPHPAATYQ